MKSKHWIASVLACASLAVAPAAFAGPRDFVVYAPGQGGSESDAQPYIDSFLRYLAGKLGWPAGSGTGQYFDEPKALSAYVQKVQPGFGLVSPAYLLQLECEKVPVTPLVAVERGGTPLRGHLYVIAKKGTLKTLADLKGKRLISNHVDDAKYVSRVALEGKLDVTSDVKLQTTPSPIKPFKAVDRGEADAALIDDGQLGKMKELPVAASLEVIYKSPELPPWPVVAFDKVVKPAERDALKKALLQMCGSLDGAETCKSMTITKFVPVSASDYAAAEQHYCKP